MIGVPIGSAVSARLVEPRGGATAYEPAFSDIEPSRVPPRLT